MKFNDAKPAYMFCRLIKFMVVPVLLASCSNGSGPEANDGNAGFGQPQIHFVPDEARITMPTALLLHNGTYHLFYRSSSVNKSSDSLQWGQATSTDLVHWEATAATAGAGLADMFPCAVVIDVNNTARLAEEGQAPIVAIFSGYKRDAKPAAGDKANPPVLAYSLDEGKTWTKYPGAVVFPNHKKDLANPVLSWNEQAGKWLLTETDAGSVVFYSSPDLKNWTKESVYGKELKARNGEWNAAGMLSFNADGTTVSALMLNPAGDETRNPAGAQYVLGRFDGHQFLAFDSTIRFLDYGPDAYDGIYLNGGDRKVLVASMNMLQNASGLPEKTTSSTLALPREISLITSANHYFLRSAPVEDLKSLAEPPLVLEDVDASNYDVSAETGNLSGPATLQLEIDTLKSFRIILSNEKEETVIGFDAARNEYFIDRSGLGPGKQSRGHYAAPRISAEGGANLLLMIDNHSIEVFADNGLTVMTALVFPRKLYTNIRLQSKGGCKISSLQFNKLRPL